MIALAKRCLNLLPGVGAFTMAHISIKLCTSPGPNGYARLCCRLCGRICDVQLIPMLPSPTLVSYSNVSKRVVGGAHVGTRF